MLMDNREEVNCVTEAEAADPGYYQHCWQNSVGRPLPCLHGRVWVWLP